MNSVNLDSESSGGLSGGAFGFVFIGVVPLTATLPLSRQIAAVDSPMSSL